MPAAAQFKIQRRILRRAFLAAPAALWAPRPAAGAAPNGFRGIFPIVATPYLENGGVDMPTLAKETRFLHRAGVHGIVWPQLASEYALLAFEERIAGAETIVTAAKGLRPKVVIGVQAEDAETAVKYAEHAKKIGPDAIIALPPRKGNQREFDLAAVEDYYRKIAAACPLPMFMQAIGNMSVAFVAKLTREIPNLYFVKDEAGHTLSRITQFLELAQEKKPLPFTGGHGRTLIDEMARGSAGSMPAASWVDLYVRVWRLWHEGRRAEAMDMFSKVMLFVTEVSAWGLPALAYVLHLRGVFPNWRVRNPQARKLDEHAKQSLERTLAFVKPYLTA